MIDMIFGVIVQSFAELRKKKKKYENDKINRCFICHINRSTLEKNRINFLEHKNNTHNLWNYVEYIISLKLNESKELNAINNYTKLKIEHNDISWLPTYKDFNKKPEKKENFLDEEKLIVPEETYRYQPNKEEDFFDN